MQRTAHREKLKYEMKWLPLLSITHKISIAHQWIRTSLARLIILANDSTGIWYCRLYSDDDIFYAYMYLEVKGKKGESDVASLIMKFLEDKGYLDGQKCLRLNVVCNNCTGQNKVSCCQLLLLYVLIGGYKYSLLIRFLLFFIFVFIIEEQHVSNDMNVKRKI